MIVTKVVRPVPDVKLVKSIDVPCYKHPLHTEPDIKKIKVEAKDSATWGNITGDINEQEDLIDLVNNNQVKTNLTWKYLN